MTTSDAARSSVAGHSVPGGLPRAEVACYLYAHLISAQTRINADAQWPMGWSVPWLQSNGCGLRGASVCEGEAEAASLSIVRCFPLPLAQAPLCPSLQRASFLAPICHWRSVVSFLFLLGRYRACVQLGQQRLLDGKCCECSVSFRATRGLLRKVPSRGNPLVML